MQYKIMDFNTNKEIKCSYPAHELYILTEENNVKKDIKKSIEYNLEELEIQFKKLLFYISKGELSNDDFMKWIHEEGNI